MAEPFTTCNTSPHPTDSGRCQPMVTLFTVPKPFGNEQHIDLIQRNAMRSWMSLAPVVDVLVVGDENGVREMAAELGARHAPGLRYNRQGTPLVSSAFGLAWEHSMTPLLAYCNCDVVLLPDFVGTLERLLVDCNLAEFVGFGRRIDLTVEQEVDFLDQQAIRQLVHRAHREGKISSQVCKEYFVFHRELYRDMPDFAIGRGNWDNWMIRQAKSSGVPVINLSQSLTAIHQSHDYQHIGADRMSCYVSGPEARRNQELAGGRHLVSGSVGTHRLTERGVERERSLLLNREFWADVPRFFRLVSGLMSRRR